MPYISCKDGQSYSRYDTSPYVKQCIKDHNEEYAVMARQCQADPVCKERTDTAESVIFGGGLLVVVLIILLISGAFDKYIIGED